MANAIKFQILNGESTKLWHCPWLRNGPISYRYEVTLIRERGLPDHALVSDFIMEHWNLPFLLAAEWLDSVQCKRLPCMNSRSSLLKTGSFGPDGN